MVTSLRVGSGPAGRASAAAALVKVGWILLLTTAALILSRPAPARAADVFVQLSPSTVQAGSLVGIRASCSDNSMPATVESPAFGMVTAQPQDGLLTAAAMVPEGTDAGSYRVVLNCPDGKNASTRLNVVAAGRPSRGPATGFGGAVGDRGRALIIGGLATTLIGAALGLFAVQRRVMAAGAPAVRGRTGR